MTAVATVADHSTAWIVEDSSASNSTNSAAARASDSSVSSSTVSIAGDRETRNTANNPDVIYMLDLQLCGSMAGSMEWHGSATTTTMSIRPTTATFPTTTVQGTAVATAVWTMADILATIDVVTAVTDTIMSGRETSSRASNITAAATFHQSASNP